MNDQVHNKLVPILTISGVVLGITAYVMSGQISMELRDFLFALGFFLLAVGTYVNNGVVWPFRPGLSMLNMRMHWKVLSGILSIASFSFLLQTIYKFFL